VHPLLPASTVRPLRILLLVAVGAVVVATVAGLVLVQRLEQRLRDTLVVAGEALDTAEAVIDPAQRLAADLGILTAQVRSLTANGADLAATATLATRDVAAALGGNLRDSVTNAASVADRTAGFVERVERFIPGDAAPSLADDLRGLAEGLEPVPQQLLDLSARLATAATSLDRAAADLDAADPALTDLVADIEAAEAALAAVPLRIEDTRASLEAAESGLGGDAWVLRILLVAAGLAGVVALVAVERLVVTLARVEVPDTPEAVTTSGAP
jgi:hypothetical protein